MKTEYGKQFLIMLSVVFVLLTGIVVYSIVTYYKTSVKNIESLGENNLKLESAKIENYLQKGIDVTWVTADSINYLMESNATHDQILDYLTSETTEQRKQIDENFTGIYGYIDGEYLDGIGWEPPSDYDPLSRNWYISGIKAGGLPTIVSPYVDAQTGKVMISIAQMLKDKKSVVSLDIELNEIQYITENINMQDLGYAFLLDDTGMVVAHFDKNENGKNLAADPEQNVIMEKMADNKSGSFSAKLNGEKCTVFTDTVFDEWHVFMVVRNDKLYHSLRIKLMLEILISLITYAVIAFFFTHTYKRIAEHEYKEKLSKSEVDHLNNVIVEALAYAIDAKDRYTSGHSKRVADYSLMIAKRMGKSEQEQQFIHQSALLHDVGKIRVPEAIINKPGKLTEQEFQSIVSHPICSFHILKNIYGNNDEICAGARFHHERYDGRGYPNNLKGNNIPEIARIIAVADAYDAMASNRSYRKALPQEIIRSELVKGRGTQFDPNIADVMISIIDEDTKYKLREQDNKIYNILAIDDDVRTLEHIKTTLLKTGEYEVTTSADYQMLSDVIDIVQPDLMIIDYDLLTEDYVQIFTSAIDKYSIPVVFMTDKLDTSDLERINSYRADDFVTKPVKGYALRETVHAILSKWT